MSQLLKKVTLLLALCSVPFSVHAAVLTSGDLKAHYADKKLKIILVPGHDNVFSGAAFRDYKEADLNVALAYHLADYLKKDPKIEVLVSREKNGDYATWLAEYVEEHGTEVLAFRDQKIAAMQEELARGAVKPHEGVEHNKAENDTGTYLYAINKYANDTYTDAVLHIHFNDHPGRRRSAPGMYTGFVAYVPDTQFANAAVSSDLARAVARRLAMVMPVSDLPLESGMIVPDQELIAIGSNRSRDGASFLIEYGYLYEPQLRRASARSKILKELAFQTYQGIEDFFIPERSSSFVTTMVPYRFARAPKRGDRESADVLALQYALKADGVYPPYPLSLSDCPMNGNFGDCTEDALVIYQQKHFGYSTGTVGPATLARLNKATITAKR